MPGFATNRFELHDPSDNTKRLRDDVSGVTTATLRTRKAQDLNGTAVISGNDMPTVDAGNLGKVDLTGQVADIASTALSNTPPAGVYEVEVYLMCTTGDAIAGALTVTIAWTDNVGATTSTPITGFVLTATGRTTGRQIVRVASGNISYSTTVVGIYATSVYAIYVRVLAAG